MKSRLTAGLLALFFGVVGAHKFYLNSNVSGVIRLIFFWTWIQAIIGLFLFNHFPRKDWAFVNFRANFKRQSYFNHFRLPHIP